MKILIAVVSCDKPKFRARMQAQRDTWVPSVKGADIRFFVGQGTAQFPDEVVLECVDDYKQLPEKCRLMFAWALANGYDWVFKSDDDCYIRPERLLAAVPKPGQHYVGRHRGGDKNTTPYCSGFGYWMSKRAMEVRVKGTYRSHAEDVCTGNILHAAGIRGIKDHRYIVHRSGYAAMNGKEGPRKGNDIICSCEYEPEVMHVIHKEFLTIPARGGIIKLKMNTPYDRIDILVKTFLRDGYLFRTVKGIEENLPGARMIIVDDGVETRAKISLYAELQARGHVVIWCKFDSGYGYKSNRANEHYNREFVLRASDDWTFDAAAAEGIKKLIAAMDANKSGTVPLFPELKLGIVSGRVNNAPFEAFVHEAEQRDGKKHVVARLVDVDQAKDQEAIICDFTVNYSLVRTEVMKTMVWDETYKIGGDHLDLYLHNKAMGFHTAWVRGVNINSQTGYSPLNSSDYGKYRRRARLALPHTFKRHGWASYTDIDGRVDTLESVTKWAEDHASYANVGDEPKAVEVPKSQVEVDERMAHFRRKREKANALRNARAIPTNVTAPLLSKPAPPVSLAKPQPVPDQGFVESDGSYCIMPGYKERKAVPHFDDTQHQDQWQKEVYERALEIFEKEELTTMLDLGCGSGWKLLKFFGKYSTIGVEVEPTLTFLKKTYTDRIWAAPGEVMADMDMVICSDVIEHVSDPDTIIKEIKRYKPKVVVISTPDRELVKGAPIDGPPLNRHHVREWNRKEFLSYLGEHFLIISSEISNQEQATHLVVCMPQGGSLPVQVDEAGEPVMDKQTDVEKTNIVGE